MVPNSAPTVYVYERGENINTSKIVLRTGDCQLDGHAVLGSTVSADKKNLPISK
jgi:hypothetical protein